MTNYLLMHKLSNFIRFLLISFLFLSCETNRDEVLSIGKKTITPTQTGKKVDMLYSDSTILKIKLQAPQMLMYDKGVKEPLTILPKGVLVIFYDRNAKESTTLKGNYAIRYEKSQRMEIKYNVEVINEKGEKLNTERLVWDEQKKKISSNAFVKITTPKEIITGNGLEANQDFTKYEIKNIIATIRLDDSPL